MSQRGAFTHQEILSQPEAWAETLELVSSYRREIKALFHGGHYEQVVFTGCGSTHYLSLAAAALFQELVGIPARGIPASEIWLSPASSLLSKGRMLLVAVSRSGETTETLRACQVFQELSRGEILTLSGYPERALANTGTLNLVFPAAQEQSIAQTRAFSSLYLAAVALAGLWADRQDVLSELERLPEAGRNLIEDCSGYVRELGNDLSLERFYFLGSGARYGLACELSLKMKEMSLSHSEPFHFLEFRHGPKSMVNEQTLIIGMLAEQNFRYEKTVMEEMHSLGAKTLAIAEHHGDIVFNSQGSEVTRNVLYLPVGQLLAFERSLAKGLDPDRPHQLDAVVKLEAR